jgi:hypothetical protein
MYPQTLFPPRAPATPSAFMPSGSSLLCHTLTQTLEVRDP